MMSLLFLGASIITTLVAASQWASKLGAFGPSSTIWATGHWEARAGTTMLSVLLWLLWLYV